MATIIQLEANFTNREGEKDIVTDKVKIPFGPTAKDVIKKRIASMVRSYKKPFEFVWVAALIRRSDGRKVYRTTMGRTAASSFGKEEG